jgi:hypothetical protein
MGPKRELRQKVVVTPVQPDLFAMSLASQIWEIIGAHPVITAPEELWSH